MELHHRHIIIIIITYYNVIVGLYIDEVIAVVTIVNMDIELVDFIRCKNYLYLVYFNYLIYLSVDDFVVVIDLLL